MLTHPSFPSTLCQCLISTSTFACLSLQSMDYSSASPNPSPFSFPFSLFIPSSSPNTHTRFLSSSLYFEIGFHVAQARFALTMQLRLIPLLPLQVLGLMVHALMVQLILGQGLNPRLPACQASTLPTSIQPQLFLRCLLVYYFFKKPYQVKSFCNLFRRNKGYTYSLSLHEFLSIGLFDSDFQIMFCIMLNSIRQELLLSSLVAHLSTWHSLQYILGTEEMVIQIVLQPPWPCFLEQQDEWHTGFCFSLGSWLQIAQHKELFVFTQSLHCSAELFQLHGHVAQPFRDGFVFSWFSLSFSSGVGMEV